MQRRREAELVERAAATRAVAEQDVVAGEDLVRGRGRGRVRVRGRGS